MKKSYMAAEDSDTGIKIYLREIGQIPLLTPEQEIDLAAKIKKGDREARALMIRSNLRLVVKIAHDYANLGLPLLDLVSEGNIGLTKAVRKTGLSQRRGNCSAGSQHFSVLHKRERIAPLLREETKVARWRRIVRLLPCARLQDADRSA